MSNNDANLETGAPIESATVEGYAQNSGKKSPASGKAVYTAADYRNFQVSMVMRISMIICFAMLFCNVVLALSLMQIAGSVRVDAVVLTKQNSTGELVDVEPVGSNMTNQSIVDEVMVKKYVAMRHNVISDPEIMSRRWGPRGIVRYLSTSPVYAEFYKSKQDFSARMAGIKSGDIPPMEIEFTSVKKLANNLWNVDFDTIEYDTMTGLASRKHWIASLRAYNIPSRARLTGSLLNPQGFVVSEYNWAQKTVK